MNATNTQSAQPSATFLPFYLPEWELRFTDGYYTLTRTFSLENRLESRRFVAEAMTMILRYERRPTVYLFKKWVSIIWHFPAEGGLPINDIVPPKMIDDLYEKYSRPSRMRS